MTPKSNARRLSDEQLRVAELVTENPLTMKGITHDRPDTSYTPDIVAEYHLPTSAPEVRCSYCERRAPHWNGFVVRFNPSKLHLIGSDCGQTKLNLQFGLAKRAHRELLDRQGYFRRLDTIIERTPDLIAGCNAVLFSDLFKEVDRSAAELEKYAGDAFLRLRALSISGRQLSEDIQVRDFTAEQKRDQNRDKPGRPIYRYERRSIGRLEGIALFRASTLRTDIFTLKKALDELPSLFRQDTNDIPTKRLRTVVTNLEKAQQEAAEATETLRAAPRFFAETHLALLEQWSESSSAGRLTVKGGQLVAVDAKGKRQAIAGIGKPDFEPIPDLYYNQDEETAKDA